MERFFVFPASFTSRSQESPGPLSSGEGLIYAVRDSCISEGPEQNNTEGTDKRLFVLDEELAAMAHLSFVETYLQIKTEPMDLYGGYFPSRAFSVARVKRFSIKMSDSGTQVTTGGFLGTV